MDEDLKRAADLLARRRDVELAMEDPAVGEQGVLILQTEADRLRDEYEQLVRPEDPARPPDPS
jgi:hypothetical protein